MNLAVRYPSLYKFWLEEKAEIENDEQGGGSSISWLVILILIGVSIATAGLGVVLFLAYVFAVVKKDFFPGASSPMGEWEQAKVRWNEKLFNSDSKDLSGWLYGDLMQARRTMRELQKSIDSKISILPELAKSGLPSDVLNEKEEYYDSAKREVEELLSSEFEKLDSMNQEWEARVKKDESRQEELRKKQKELDKSIKEKKKGLQSAVEARVISQEEYERQVTSLGAQNELADLRCKGKSMAGLSCSNFALEGSPHCADHICRVPDCDKPVVRSKLFEGFMSAVGPDADELQFAFCDKHSMGLDS